MWGTPGGSRSAVGGGGDVVNADLQSVTAHRCLTAVASGDHGLPADTAGAIGSERGGWQAWTA